MKNGKSKKKQKKTETLPGATPPLRETREKKS